MRRKSFDALVSVAGLVVATLLLAASGLLFWAHGFVTDNVRTQLVAQKIFMPAGEALNDPAIKPYLTRYAGQQLTTGDQAKAFADHYIAVHLRAANGGFTYSELSAQSRANPTSVDLQQKVQSSFRGETLRGMLLNAYAFGQMAKVALIAGWIALGTGSALLVLALLGLVHARRTSYDVQVHVPGWHPEQLPIS
jgi:hypothetical protein